MDELKNALAWFKAAPGNLYTAGKENLQAMAQWIWEVIQGDFNEDQTTAQVVTGTVISMIPFVDQICDVRDVVANCKKINDDTSNKWAWVALVLTLIGLFPTLGSLVKGGLKVLFAYGRKGVFSAGAKALDSGMWQATKPWVEAGIGKFNDFLARPEVRRALKALKIDNPYKYFAKQVRDIAASLNVGKLTAAMDTAITALKGLTDKIKKWGPESLGKQAGDLVAMVQRVRSKADEMLGQALRPVTDWLNRLGRRLEVEADMKYRAYTNSVNPHAFTRTTLDAEIAQFKAAKPAWADVVAKHPNKPMEDAPTIPAGYPNVGPKGGALAGKYRTFHTLEPLEIPPGTTIYRIVDPASNDNSFFWMTKAEFDKLKSKDDWRRRLAVWANWNKNGEFVTYTVPPGKPLKVWEGKAASQQLLDSSNRPVSAGAPGKGYYLEGGASQIVLDPAQLDKSFLGKRQPTGWGYNSFNESTSLVGVPTLTNYWYEKK
jgi:hypothetical protein